MTETVGSAAVELLLNRSRFDRDIKELEGLDLKIPVSVQIDLDSLRSQLQKEFESFKFKLPSPTPSSGSGGSGGSSPGAPSDEAIFRTNAALTAQRVKEDLQAERDAARQRLALEQEAQQQIEEARRQSLDRIAIISAQEEGIIRAQQSERLEVIERGLRQEVLDAQEAQELIQKVNADTSRQLIVEYQRRAAALEQAQAQGLIGEREAAQQTLALQKQISAETARIARSRVQEASNRQAAPAGGLDFVIQKANNFQQAVEEAQRYTIALNQLSQTLTVTGQRVQQFSSQMLAASGAYDAAVAKVGTLTNDSTELQNSLRELTRDLGFQASTTELLNSSYDVLSSGFTETADATRILEAASKGAIGGFSDTNTVADALTSTLNAYGESADQASAFVDKFIAVQNAGKIVLDQYAQQIGRVAPLAAQAGVGIDELNGFIATATIKGVQAEASFAGLRQAIASTLKPTVQAQELADKLGIRFDATALRTQGLSGILGELNARGLDTAENLTVLFGSVEAVAAIAPSAGEGFSLLQQNIEASANSAGSAQAAFETVAASFDGQVRASLNQTNEALVSMGNGIKGFSLPLLQALTFLVGAFNKLPEPIKGAVGVVVALTGGALTLGGALAALAATIPVIKAGLAELGIRGVAAGTGLGATGAGANLASLGLGKMAVAAGALLIKMALIGAAIASVQLALSRFKDGGATFNEGADEIRQRLVDLQLEAGRTREEIENTIPKEPPPTDFIDGLVTKFNQLNAFLNRSVGLPEDFLRIPTNADKQIEDARRGVTELKESVGELTSEARNIGSGFQEGVEPTTDQLAIAQRLQNDFSTAIADTKERLSSLNASALGTTAYTELKQNLEASIAELEREQALLQQRTGVVAQDAAATDQATGAIEEQTSAVDRLNQSLERRGQLAEADRTFAQAETAEAVAQGFLTEEQARQKDLEAESAYLQEKLAINQENIERLIALRRNANSTEELTDINQQIFDAEEEAAQTRIDVAKNVTDQRIAEEQRATEAIKREQDKIALDATQRTTEVRQQQASGGITEEEAESQIAQIQADSVQKQIALIEKRLQAVRAGSEEEAKLTQELAGLQLQAVEQQIEAQERLKQARLDDVEEANRRAEEEIKRSQTERLTIIRQAQLEGKLSEEDAQLEIDKIQQEGTERTIARKREELDSIRQLRAEGILSAEEATDREAALTQEIGDLNLQRIEAEIEARRRLAEEQVNQQFEPQLQQLDTRQNQSQGSLDLLNAQSGLQESINNLQQEQLNTKIAQAEADGRSFEAERLREEQLELQAQQMEQQNALQLQQLELQQQIRQIELERQLIEAQMAVAQAEANGATDEEIAKLQDLVGLAQQQLDLQQQLNQAERDTLRNQQEINRERQKQNEIQAEGERGQSSSSSGRGQSSSNGAGIERILTSSVVEGQRAADEAFKRALSGAGDQRINLLNEAIAGGVNNGDFLRRLDQAGLGELGNIAALVRGGALSQNSVLSAASQAQSSGRDPFQAIQALAESVSKLAASPRSLTVSTPDAVGDTGRILADISSQSLGSAGL